MMMVAATPTNTSLSTSAGAWAATTPPTITPTTTGAAHTFSTSSRTAPFFKWARNDWIEVGMMMASEEPTARCIRTSSGTPSTSNT